VTVVAMTLRHDPEEHHAAGHPLQHIGEILRAHKGRRHWGHSCRRRGGRSRRRAWWPTGMLAPIQTRQLSRKPAAIAMPDLLYLIFLPLRFNFLDSILAKFPAMRSCGALTIRVVVRVSRRYEPSSRFPKQT
jgi:hypothetical protein